MFRIKTDIRQFNCETQEKVEKLIVRVMKQLR